jgi:thymidylate kinase
MTWICIDGVEGAGKTTLVRRLQSSLSDISIVDEFSDGFCGRALRSAVEDSPHFVSQSRLAQSLFFLAEFIERVEQHHKVITDTNSVIIFDRGPLSKLVYQVVVLEPEFGTFAAKQLVKQILSRLPKPDLTIWLKVASEAAFDRVKLRADRPYGGEFQTLEALCRGFEMYAADFNSIMVDSELNDPEGVFVQAMAAISELRS